MKPLTLLSLWLISGGVALSGTSFAKKRPGTPPLPISPDTIIYKIADQMPNFRGRPFQSALVEWIGSQLRYPADMLKDKRQSKVWASFIVERDRTISHIEISSSPDKSFSLEVLRVLNNMPPAWTPGINDQGEAVRVRIYVPVTFHLE